ncbi:hypothetical protein JCM11491_001617 [Sporobolomyces phaffii]
MRRFPAPPVPSTAGTRDATTGGVPSSTPTTTPDPRSVEAPMQYEWERPRQFPTSLFATPSSTRTSDDGERARKRTHYEAMDVDTPPPAPAAAAVARDATTAVRLEPLVFDAKKDFDRPGALGFHRDELDEVVMADHAEDLVADANADADAEPRRAARDEHLALATTTTTTTTRRRAAAGKGKKAAAPVTIETDDEDGLGEDDNDAREREGEGFLGTLQRHIGPRGTRRGEFSFQVHHHHAPGGGGAGGGVVVGPNPTPERWLQSNTPYVLLGYLQFGSLTLFALLVLSLLVLFLYTLYTDIQSRLASLTVELRSEMLQCARAYVDNRCEPATRIPAMERRCSEWEECMNRDVVVVGKTRVVAETLAEIVNGFVDVISFKTMLFVLLTLGITIYGSSAALSVLASRATANHGPGPDRTAAAHFYPPPYGLPYNAGQTPWVIDDGTRSSEPTSGHRLVGFGGGAAMSGGSK